MSVRSSIAVLAVLAVVGLLTFGLLSKGGSNLELGDPAPTTTLVELEGGGTASLADYRGRWVLVNFWASWCPPCREEASTLERFQQQHAGPRFTTLGITSRDLTSDSLAFVREYGLTYPQLRDGDGSAADDYGTTGLPESFLVDPRGKVRLIARGPVGEEYLREEVAPLLPKAES